MTTHDDNSRVETELAALGEPAPSRGEHDVEGDPDVRTVATLVAIAHTDPATLPPLSALSRRRVWSTLEGRLAAVAFTPPVVTDPHAPAANVGPGWRAVLLGLAAAAVLILPRVGAGGAEIDAAELTAAERERLEQLGAQAREGVAALGDQGEPRARDLAAKYAARLSAHGGETP